MTERPELDTHVALAVMSQHRDRFQELLSNPMSYKHQMGLPCSSGGQKGKNRGRKSKGRGRKSKSGDQKGKSRV